MSQRRSGQLECNFAPPQSVEAPERLQALSVADCRICEPCKMVCSILLWHELVRGPNLWTWCCLCIIYIFIYIYIISWFITLIGISTINLYSCFEFQANLATLRQSNVAMENPSCTEDCPSKTSFYRYGAHLINCSMRISNDLPCVVNPPVNEQFAIENDP